MRPAIWWCFIALMFSAPRCSVSQFSMQFSWCYYSELMFVCQYTNSLSLFIACKSSNLGFWATEIHSTIPWSFSLFRSATKANPTFLPLYAAFSATPKPQHTAMIFRSEISVDYHHLKHSAILRLALIGYIH